jgi:hypothetical protein
VIFALSNDISHGLWECVGLSVCVAGAARSLPWAPAATRAALRTLLFL